MENEADAYLHLQWVIYNDKLGIHDLVQIGFIEEQEGMKVAYLDVLYEMVGPFCFETLLQEGVIKFAACSVMSQQLWRQRAKEIREEMFLRARQREEAFAHKAREYNGRKHNVSEYHFRVSLGLPLEGVIDLKEIKSAYKTSARTAHPDAGGTQEDFCALQEAYEALVSIYQNKQGDI